MNTIIDFHSHILPGIDDGSASLEESIAMLRLEAEQGIRQVVATPHFYANHDTPENFIRRRERAEAVLREEMSKYTDFPQVSVGAEVYFFRGISNSDCLSELTIAKNRCIMVEMPNFPWTDQMYGELEDIYVKRGLTPIVAHLDRYIGPFRTRQILERLEQLPVFIQVNAEFFINRSTKRIALRMLKENRIHLLGSDCHNLSDRPPNLGTAVSLIEQKLGSEFIQQIGFNQSEILFGREVMYF